MIYVIQTKPNQESELLKELRRISLTAYAPSENRQIRCRGKWHTQNNLIFSGYIFIELEQYSAELFHKVHKLTGFLKFLGCPSPLSASEEEQIKYLFNEGKPIELSFYTDKNGYIEFTCGVMTSLWHKILKIYPRQKRAKVEIIVNGKKFMVSLPIEKI